MNEKTSLVDLQKKGKMVARDAGGGTVKAFFEANKAAIAAVLPAHVRPERMMKIALGALRTTPQLQECTVQSLFGAVVATAQLGLEPNTPMGHAYLIPFRNKKAGRTDVQLIIGYRGLLDLSRRSGQIVSIAAHAVREHDEFEFEYGLSEQCRHIPASVDRGEITHVYAVAKLVGGGHAFEVMGVDDVRGIMRRTQSRGEYGPWRDHFEEMARKTAIRRLFKYLPVSIELATATAMDEAADDSSRTQNLESVLEGEWTAADSAETEEEEREETRPQEKRRDEQPAEDSAEQPKWPKKFVDEETGEDGWTDSEGTFFDPEKHGLGSDDTPSVTSRGVFRKRRGSASDGHAENPQANSPKDASGDQDDDGFGGLE